MLQKFKVAGLLWPTLAALALASLLLTLGSWQWNRKAWKEGLIAAQSARATQTPAPLEDLLTPGAPAAGLEYRRVTLRGAFDHSGECYLYTPLASGPGWGIMTPFLIAGGKGRGAINIFVDRGFVPDGLRLPASRAAGQPAGEVTLTGRIRLTTAKGSFAADNDWLGNRWFWRDVAGMWASLPPRPITADGGRTVVYVYVEADTATANPGGWPKPGGSDALFNNLSNRHLEYALTWWALAATLLGMYAVFAWPKLRAR
jgi:surfeit locus 1 family protein